VAKKVIIHEEGLQDLLDNNPELRGELWQVGNRVAAAAAATASSAENGPGGTISGYAEAGFIVSWYPGGKGRPSVHVTSKADIKTALAAHFHTQKRDGVGHLRAALRTQT
jgi:hypothetical protein